MKHYSGSDMLTIGIGIAFTLMGLVGIRQEPSLIWATLFFFACVLILVLQPFLARWRPARYLRVEYDVEAIRNYGGAALPAVIRWDEIDEIAVLTSEIGPAGDDVVWVFSNASGSPVVLIAGTSPGFAALLAELQRLPNFDNEALLMAMGSLKLARFIVWRRAM